MLHFVGRWDVGWSRGGRKWSVNCKRGLLAKFGTSDAPRWANLELFLVASPTLISMAPSTKGSVVEMQNWFCVWRPLVAKFGGQLRTFLPTIIIVIVVVVMMMIMLLLQNTEGLAEVGLREMQKCRRHGCLQSLTSPRQKHPFDQKLWPTFWFSGISHMPISVAHGHITIQP